MEWARDRGARLDRTFEKGPVRHILFDPAAKETFGKTAPEVAQKSDIVLTLPEQ